MPGGIDLLGYAAAALVLLAFSLRSLAALRTVAIASNLMFMIYAAGAHLPPVFALHAALLPVNLWRLWQGLRGARACPIASSTSKSPEMAKVNPDVRVDSSAVV